MQINVKRRPYSFLGDSQSATGKRHKGGTWHDGLLGYVGGDEVARDEAERQLQQQGREAGITFDFNVLTHWQPVDSQRMLLWAGRFGLQEQFMTEINERHFQRGSEGESASDRATLLAAAEAVGLDAAAARAFIESGEYVDDVWSSYGETIKAKNIHSIPLFVFSAPQLGLVGGPFRAGPGTPFVINGSMDAPTFLRVFEAALAKLEAGASLVGRRVAVSGVISKPELNGRRGLADGFSESSGRYAVRLDGAEEPVAFKPANLAEAVAERDGAVAPPAITSDMADDIDAAVASNAPANVPASAPATVEAGNPDDDDQEIFAMV